MFFFSIANLHKKYLFPHSDLLNFRINYSSHPDMFEMGELG